MLSVYRQATVLGSDVVRVGTFIRPSVESIQFPPLLYG